MSQEFASQAPPPLPNVAPRRSRSGILLGMGIGCGVAMLLLCGGVGVFAVYSYRLAESMVSRSDEPEVIRARTAEIAEIDLPADFLPDMAFDMRVPVVGQRLWSWTVYSDKSDGDEYDNFLVLGQFYQDVSRNTREQLMARIDQSIRDHEHDTDVDEQIDEDKKSSETRELTIHGEPAEFIFSSAKGQVSNEKYWVVSGQFKGKEGTAVLHARANAAKYEKSDLEQMVESIR